MYCSWSSDKLDGSIISSRCFCESALDMVSLEMDLNRASAGRCRGGATGVDECDHECDPSALSSLVLFASATCRSFVASCPRGSRRRSCTTRFRRVRMSWCVANFSPRDIRRAVSSLGSLLVPHEVSLVFTDSNGKLHPHASSNGAAVHSSFAVWIARSPW